LSGCETIGSETHCPPLPGYTAAEQARAAEELEKLPADSMARRLVTDYGRIRAQCRALNKEKRL